MAVSRNAKPASARQRRADLTIWRALPAGGGSGGRFRDGVFIGQSVRPRWNASNSVSRMARMSVSIRSSRQGGGDAVIAKGPCDLPGECGLVVHDGPFDDAGKRFGTRLRD